MMLELFFMFGKISVKSIHIHGSGEKTFIPPPPLVKRLDTRQPRHADQRGLPAMVALDRGLIAAIHIMPERCLGGDTAALQIEGVINKGRHRRSAAHLP